MLHQRGDVLLAPAQRRHLDGDDVQPGVEVLAEAPLGDLFLQVLVGRGEHADVHADGVLAAHPLEGLLLEDAQHLPAGRAGAGAAGAARRADGAIVSRVAGGLVTVAVSAGLAFLSGMEMRRRLATNVGIVAAAGPRGS